MVFFMAKYNSAVQTLKHLENMVSRVSLTPQQQTIAEAVDIIVYLRMNGMQKYENEIIGVDGYDEVKYYYITRQTLYRILNSHIRTRPSSNDFMILISE